MKRKRKKRQTVLDVLDDGFQTVMEGRDIFIVKDGVKIARRGHPGTSQPKTWVSLEPGWTVTDDGFEMTIIYDGVTVH